MGYMRDSTGRRLDSIPLAARTEILSQLKMTDLTGPVIIPHKGGVNWLPEHTEYAYKTCLALGFPVIDLDARTLFDGQLANIHDSTIDNLTTGTGNVSAQTALTFPLLIADVAAWTASAVGPGWPNGNVDTIGSFLARYGHRQVPQIESKNATATEVGKIVSLLQAMKLDKRAVVSAGNLAALVPSVAAGIDSHLISNAPDATATRAAGVYDVVMDIGVVSDTTVQNAIAGGLRVWLFDVTRRYDRDRYVTMGVRGFYSGDPLYFRATTPLHTVDSFSTGMYPPGTLIGTGGRGTLSSGKLSWPVGANQWALMGFLGPITATSYTMSFTLTFTDPGASASAYGGAHICELDDRAYTNNAASSGYRAGYRVMLQQNGTLQINRTDADGTVTVVGSVATTAPTVGQSIVVTVQVSPTQIIASIPGKSCTATDSTYRGGYVHLGQTGNGGTMVTAHSAVSVA